jgi:hypothetical protein
MRLVRGDRRILMEGFDGRWYLGGLGMRVPEEVLPGLILIANIKI